MEFGTVVYLAPNGQGYGFIKPEKGGADDIFFNGSGCVARLFDRMVKGDRVSYEVKVLKAGDKRPRAINVSKVS